MTRRPSVPLVVAALAVATVLSQDPRAYTTNGARWNQPTASYVINPANLDLIEQLIARRLDLRLLSVGDGDLGIEYARAYQPDVILMDVNLPGISGLEAMKILHADPATAHIPIVALSANAVPREIARCLEAGFFDYVTKPIKVDAFMAALDHALDHSHAIARRSARVPLT